MEADWEFEVGGDAPIIEAHWSGFVDLRANSQHASALSECRDLPELADALIRLNAPDSPVWTSKIDVFTPDRIDPDEMAASSCDAAHASTCYIDLLPRSDQIWDTPSKVERECRRICANLKVITLSRCRVDLVVRRAVEAGTCDLGMTVYLTACGPTPADARERLAECLALVTDVIAPGEIPHQR